MKIQDILEAAYRGNLGAMEMHKFYRVATPEQKEHMKKLLNSDNKRAVWGFLQKVTGMILDLRQLDQ
jgi:hypothetical protein